MENPTDEAIVVDSVRANNSISFQIENKSDKVKSVNIFSSEPNDENISITILGNSGQVNYDEFLKELSEKKSCMVTSGIRVYGSGIEDFIECITHSKTRDLVSSSYKVMPILYMSPYYMMSDRLEIYPYNMWIESGFDLSVKAPPHKTITYHFFIEAELEDKNDSASKRKWMSLHGAKPIYGDCIPILLVNPTDSIQEVNLFDVSSEDNKQSPVSIGMCGMSDYSYLLKTIEAGSFNRLISKMNSVKIWSDNSKQLMRYATINSTKGESHVSVSFRPVDYMSPAQCYDNFADINSLPLKDYFDGDKTSIKISLEPKTTALYLFYELISDRERDIAQFEIANKNVLDRLKLKLVRE